MPPAAAAAAAAVPPALQVPRAATIHEYLDWTVTASEAEDPDELDFGGFRVVVLLPRFRPQWPPPPPPGYPAADYAAEEALKHGGLIGAPKPPVPILAVSCWRGGVGWLDLEQ